MQTPDAPRQLPTPPLPTQPTSKDENCAKAAQTVLAMAVVLGSVHEAAIALALQGRPMFDTAGWVYRILRRGPPETDRKTAVELLERSFSAEIIQSMTSRWDAEDAAARKAIDAAVKAGAQKVGAL